MNRYETVFIATPVLSDVQLKELVGKFQGVITENGGKVTHTEEWGLRKLAYPIQKKSTGFYTLLEFEAEGNLINILETQYKRDERIIRFLTFKQEKYAAEYADKRKKNLKSGGKSTATPAEEPAAKEETPVAATTTETQA